MTGKRRGERQCLAIARAVYFGAKVLILDEPTSALGVHQASVVLKLIVQSKARGIGVIFISHNVHHAYVVGDRFALLKRGKSTGTHLKDEISRDELLNLMAGGKELVDLEAEIARLGKGRGAHTSLRPWLLSKLAAVRVRKSLAACPCIWYLTMRGRCSCR